MENECGGASDHNILNARLTIPHHHEFQWKTYRTQEMTVKNDENFTKVFCEINWETLLGPFRNDYQDAREGNRDH